MFFSLSERLIHYEGMGSREAVVAQRGGIIRRRMPDKNIQQNRNVVSASIVLENGLAVITFLTRMAHCFTNRFNELEQDLANQWAMDGDAPDDDVDDPESDAHAEDNVDAGENVKRVFAL